MSDRIFKLIVPLGEVPEGATVTKRTGDKKHLVKNKVRIYTDPNDSQKYQEVSAQNGARFLVADNGFHSALGSGTEVVWHASRHDLQELIDPPDDK